MGLKKRKSEVCIGENQDENWFIFITNEYSLNFEKKY